LIYDHIKDERRILSALMSSLRRILGISKSSLHFSEYCIFSSSSSWSDCRPPSNFVNAHVRIDNWVIWFVVWRGLIRFCRFWRWPVCL